MLKEDIHLETFIRSILALKLKPNALHPSIVGLSTIWKSVTCYFIDVKNVKYNNQKWGFKVIYLNIYIYGFKSSYQIGTNP